MVEFPELDSSIARALLDNTISAEARHLRSEWEDVIGWMQRFTNAS